MTKKRNPAVTGALGIVVILLATMSAFFLDSLPIVGAANRYTAEFTEAAGLKAGNEVRVAGVKVGKVTGIDLDGDRVLVTFQTKDAWVGDQSTASIQIKTILGQKYLSLDPRGTEVLRPGVHIPLERTTSPYDVIDAFSDAATTLEEIDTTQLASSFDVLSQSFAGTPDEIRGSLDGVARLSETVSKRDQELKKLFEATKHTSQILADRNEQFEQILANGGTLLAELNTRQQAIGQLLTTTQTLSRELTGLVADNEAQITPALTQLQGAIDLLNRNQQNVSKALEYAAPFYRIYANVLGNGRWFDTVVTNLTPPGLPDIPGYREPMRTLGGN
ncbi:MCE family protein [Rhodococcus sp. SGAir0479]|uniref:MCE family protein n=1 Tax=Rhodococcus sp. SGAir0479 TaxID=2567884 RepID=UPI0010CD522B|nr:MCE family protein [Rhodococcus sp. SGAir0479]QCQ92263.1 MCE family protein [Rhodococcus sp. SGAir0479]